MDCSLPGSPVHGILKARILELVALPSPRDLLDPGIKPASLMSPALAGRFFVASATWEALSLVIEVKLNLPGFPHYNTILFLFKTVFTLMNCFSMTVTHPCSIIFSTGLWVIEIWSLLYNEVIYRYVLNKRLNDSLWQALEIQWHSEAFQSTWGISSFT